MAPLIFITAMPPSAYLISAEELWREGSIGYIAGLLSIAAGPPCAHHRPTVLLHRFGY